MKGEIELYNISFLILKVNLHFKYEFRSLIFTKICLRYLHNVSNLKL